MRTRLAIAILALLVLAGCGGSSDKKASSTPTVDPKTAITKAWESFFNSAGTVAAHEALLENGSTFESELTALAKNPASAGLSAKVISVIVDGKSASVVYDLIGKDGTTKLLTGASGKAVEQDGTWKVSKFTYCQLVGLQDPNGKHPACA